MSWLSENWFWILVAIAFVALHLFGHGRHGGHGGHRRSQDDREHGAYAGLVFCPIYNVLHRHLVR